MDEKYSRGGCPKKGLAEKLSYRVSIKLCTKDYYKLKSNAQIAGITITEFARQAITKSKITPRITIEQMNLIRQLSGIANNINQLARKAHAYGFKSSHGELSKLLPRIDRIITLIEDDS